MTRPEPDSRLLRLLPWSDADGKTALLSTDGTETYLSRLADRVEEQQIETAAIALKLTRPMVEDGAHITVSELRWAARRLIESLKELLVIAESRGQRIPPYAQAHEGSGRTGDE
ncbi:hypothetical protein IGX29_15710 [Streptomyces sp. H28]|uniref:hypothetical protein n=1 Tax=Streptomyces sp. H28 TaxID=2775865 RepID=UPI00178429C7|nr:hypothetical protein [Streptomyces sp. H28]MBD9733224.1 hypothetical protein [Streptomyces sp. H28]